MFSRKLLVGRQHRKWEQQQQQQYARTHASLLSNTKADCSCNLMMTSFNWQKNDVEKGKMRKEKAKPMHSVTYNVDTNETADKKKFSREKQFNDDSRHFLSSLYTCLLVLVVSRLAVVPMASMVFFALLFLLLFPVYTLTIFS
jgi:Flp pilus assembly protein TadB